MLSQVTRHAWKKVGKKVKIPKSGKNPFVLNISNKINFLESNFLKKKMAKSRTRTCEFRPCDSEIRLVFKKLIFLKKMAKSKNSSTLPFFRKYEGV